MTDPIDLDRLDALHAGCDQITSDSEFGWEMFDAWPAISAELRRLRAENEKLRAERDQGDDDGN